MIIKLKFDRHNNCQQLFLHILYDMFIPYNSLFVIFVVSTVITLFCRNWVFIPALIDYYKLVLCTTVNLAHKIWRYI
jgi:hypothetical protein